MKSFFRYAILGPDGNPQECDIQTWMPWFIEHANPDLRRVALDQVGDYEISTVFVGCGLTYFETAVFNAEGEAISQERTDTKADALSMHAFTRVLVKAGKHLPDVKQ